MTRVNGLFGHKLRNNRRSILLFGGFLAALNLLVACILALPLFVLDTMSTPLLYPDTYMLKYGVWVTLAGILYFAVLVASHLDSVQEETEFAFVEAWSEPRLHRTVDQIAITAGIKKPRVAVIETPVLNAFACGISQRSAVVVVTRGLLNALNDWELRAVVAHEISHIRNDDTRLVACTNAMLSALSHVERFSTRKIGWLKIAVGFFVIPLLLIWIAQRALSHRAMLLGRASRYLIVSSREFVADVEAVELTHDAGALVSALLKIQGRSRFNGLAPATNAMMIDGEAVGESASHPTIAERVEALVRHAGSMAFEAVHQSAPDSLVHDCLHNRPSFGLRSSLPRPVVNTVPVGVFNRVKGAEVEGRHGMNRAKILACAAIPAFYVGLQAFTIVSYNMTGNVMGMKIVKSDPFNTAITGMVDRAAIDASVLWKEVEGLISIGSLNSRCYNYQNYTVGDRGMYNFTLPGIIRPGDEKRWSSDIKVEKYVYERSISILNVKNASTKEELIEALSKYIEVRMSLTIVMHRFFGEEGLEYYLSRNASAEDAEMIELIKANREELKSHVTKPRAVKNGRLPWGLDYVISSKPVPHPDQLKMADAIDLLVESPVDFIPCVARAMSRLGVRTAR